MNYTNNANLPEEIVKAVLNDPYTSGNADISVTGLIAPPQQQVLLKRHNDSITVDVSSRLFALYGSIGHGIIEQSGAEGKFVEKRHFAEFEGWTVSGATDLYDDGIISDYKYCSTYVDTFGGSESKPEWGQQLNIYAELWRRAGYPVTGLQIVALFRDWRKSEAKRNRDYPQTPVKIYKINLWTQEEAVKFIEKRVLLHKKARGLPDNQLPECTAEERWAKPDVYAVMKSKDHKRATKLHSSKKEAVAHKEKLGDKAIVIFRPGVSTRCEDWCDCSEVCCQFKKIKEQ